MILYLSIFLIMLELFYYECGTIVPVALYRLLYISKKQSEIYLILIIKSDDAMVAIFKRASHRAVKFFFSF